MLDEVGNGVDRHDDYVEFVRAGAPAAGAYRCSGCGYGVTVRASLPSCPMCGGTTWEQAASAQFASPRLQ
jgi:rubredoxin